MIRVELSKITNGQKRKQKFNLAKKGERQQAQNFIDGVDDYKYEWWDSNWAEIDEFTELEDIIQVASIVYNYDYNKFKAFQFLMANRMESPIDVVNAIADDKVLVLPNKEGLEHKNYHRTLGEHAYDEHEDIYNTDYLETEINGVPLSAYLDYEQIGKDYYTENVFYHTATSEETFYRLV